MDGRILIIPKQDVLIYAEAKIMNKECYQTSLRLLTRKDYSRYKLAKKLKEKGYEESDIEETIQTLLDKNYLKEHYYIEAFVKAHMRRGYSPRYIQQKLSMEECSCSEHEIQNIFHEYGYSEESQIRELIEKKFTHDEIKDYNKRAKCIRFLLSKGHETQLTQHILDNL